jgi:phosphoribosylformylglycinamidine (FGAM) synthase PurS component
VKNKFGIRIMPREVILDTQGRAVEQTLKLSGQNGVGVRVGRFVELEIDGDESQALKTAEKIAKDVLHNPLIETFTIQKAEK